MQHKLKEKMVDGSRNDQKGDAGPEFLDPAAAFALGCWTAVCRMARPGSKPTR